MAWTLGAALALHALAAVVWVGGMVALHQCLRPALGILDPPQPLHVMRGTLARFFRFVWIAVVALPLTGYWLIFKGYGGFAGAPVSVHVMHLLGWVMIALYLHLHFAPWRRLNAACEAEDWETGARNLAQIRRIVGINMALGIVVVLIAGGGRYIG